MAVNILETSVQSRGAESNTVIAHSLNRPDSHRKPMPTVSCDK